MDSPTFRRTHFLHEERALAKVAFTRSPFAAMKRDGLDSGAPGQRPHWPRRNARTAVDAEVILRRPGQLNYRVRIYDVSPNGCRIEFVERPRLDDRVWIKFEGLEALEALVCWVDGFVAGVELERPIHPAVFDFLVRKLG